MSQLNIQFETDELNELFETGTSIGEMREIILHLLKKQRKSQQINLNKLSNIPEPSASEQIALHESVNTSPLIVKTIPHNSGIPIAKRLTGLTTDEMLQTVLSNAFVPDIVTQNTIIWDNWDIFSKTKYLWKVVRKRPDWVKLWVINKFNYLVCRPVDGNNNYYEALHCRIDGRCSKITKETKQLSLYEAVSACENFIYSRDRANPYTVEPSKYNTKSKILAPIISTADIEKELVALGVNDNVVKDLLREGYYSYKKVCEMLSADIEPEENVLSQLRGKFRELDLLSKSEAQSILEQITYKKGGVFTTRI